MTPSAAPSARRSSHGRPHPRSFYDRETAAVARDLLGSVLEHRTAAGTLRGRIVEVEAYLGPHDPACHSATGWSERTRHLHGPPGTVYVYLIYGMHWCVNAVTREAGHGSAVLLRAVEPLAGIDVMRGWRGRLVGDRRLASGPGNLCRAFGIDRRHDGTTFPRGALRILAGHRVADAEVVTTPRIGITKAAEWPLRFAVRGSAAVSGSRQHRLPAVEQDAELP